MAMCIWLSQTRILILGDNHCLEMTGVSVATEILSGFNLYRNINKMNSLSLFKFQMQLFSEFIGKYNGTIVLVIYKTTRNLF